MKLGHLLGCHQLGSRSFFIKGYQFPVCARCTGIYLGLILGVFFKISLLFSLLSIIPLLLDGLTQLLTKYQSNNIKRIGTGLLFGIGFANLFLILLKEAF
ncbi:DUF2085 domain-containing protein [Acetobacterium sp.]|uniref:DUF2085 domain-containing protein n=1 Tax=Acetobacterium sp. TaxID=1872094 RepID=UPI000CC6E310|nr:DUF2085 domain-containing protein [Acetobacterium sp.]MDO9493422.1 DUF2085 domain-containing protein [Acetobacterium sp.]PKM75421.1 MAG: hypothetical protein CVU92_01445 [Firmicutes bacterium HGW-Firmicutes-17]